jgi:hypothetical protein
MKKEKYRSYTPYLRESGMETEGKHTFMSLLWSVRIPAEKVWLITPECINLRGEACRKYTFINFSMQFPLEGILNDT